MPSARSRLADIEGPGLGKPLTKNDVDRAIQGLTSDLRAFLGYVEASKTQRIDALCALEDLIADATARQLREIEDGEDS